MQTNIIWTGQEYNSIENCVVSQTQNGTTVDSVIIGAYLNIPYRIAYRLIVNAHWETTLVELKTQLFNKLGTLRYESDGSGHWIGNGKTTNVLSGCKDVDISLTPFTNTLPIKRLQLQISESREIVVLYFDLLEQNVKTVRQKYSRISLDEYKFENVPNDFEAIIKVDKDRLVVDYPGLFKMTHKL